MYHSRVCSRVRGRVEVERVIFFVPVLSRESLP